jgi:hypothetical protein
VVAALIGRIGDGELVEYDQAKAGAGQSTRVQLTGDSGENAA